MSKRKFQIRKQGLLPGYASGRYETRVDVPPQELGGLADLERRDQRVSVRLRGGDLERLQGLALARGIPLQSLLADVLRDYARAAEREAAAAAAPPPITELRDADPQADAKGDGD